MADDWQAPDSQGTEKLMIPNKVCFCLGAARSRSSPQGYPRKLVPVRRPDYRAFHCNLESNQAARHLRTQDRAFA